MPYFRKKSPIEEAHQYVIGQPLPNGLQFIKLENGDQVAFVTTTQGENVAVKIGDWVITEAGGKGYHAIPNEKFQQTHEFTNDI